MSRVLLAALALFIAPSTPAFAQMTTTPGPGGVPIAPGAPVTGYTPGGIGPGGVEIAPGSAARGVPMHRIGPGGVAMPPAPDPAPDAGAAGPAAGIESRRRVAGVPRPQSLQLTIGSRDAGQARAPSPDKEISSIDELFAALRACWEPPLREQAREGVQMSVRFSLKRGGDVVAPPFVTYTTPGTEAYMKRIYRQAITASLERCTPLPLSKSFTAAIVGRPLSVRYVDDRVIDATRKVE